MEEKIKVLLASIFGMFSVEYFAKGVNFIIGILTVIYLIYKILNEKDKRKKPPQF